MISKQTPVVFGHARFTVYSEGCVRLEYANDGRFVEGPSLLVGRKTARSIRASVHQSKASIRIRTGRFELTYKPDGKSFSANNIKIEHKNAFGGDEVWTPGKRDAGNLGTVTRSLDFWHHLGGPERYPTEGILSTDGGHLLADEPRVYWNKKFDWPETHAHHIAFDGYFFAYGRDYKAALKDLVTVLGPIPMVPRWVFGFWYSRWFAYKDKEFVAIAKRYRRQGIPMDVMVIDTDWRDNWGGYDWSKKFFPQPRKAMQTLRRMNLRTTLNDHPGYDNYDALPASDSHIPAIARKLGALPHQGQWACDWSRKDAVQVWRDLLLGPFFKDGMDFWWVDGWIKPSFGSLDSQLWSNYHYYDLAEEKSRNRGLILSRWGGIGSHRYPVQFSGDTFSNWETLRHQVEFTARSGNLGAAYWSHDIGGFHDKRVDEELYCRWVQFGSLSPVFRTHSAHGFREPWHYSSRFKTILKKQTRLRYALAPFFYTLAHEAHETGLPLARPLYLEYNRDGDRGARERKHQYTLGRDVLVIPGDHAVDKQTGVQRKRVYFPGGVWYALESNEVIQGVDDRWIGINLDVIPVYVRGGAIIPCQAVGEYLGSRPPREIQFDFYPSQDESSRLDLYEDDGESKEYERGRSVRTRLEGRRTGTAVNFSISAPRGSYRGMWPQRVYVLRARLEPGDTVRRAEIRLGDGPWRKVKHSMTSSVLAGTVNSGYRFCQVRVVSDNKPVQIRLLLAE